MTEWALWTETTTCFHLEGALGWTFSFPRHNVHVSKPLKKLWEGSDLKSLKGNGILGLR